jgi:hypothetical protein
MQTLTYTFGIGLNGSACVAVTGWQMTDALPDTILAPETVITVSAVNDSGASMVGDQIAGVTLFGELTDVVGATAPLVDLVPGLLPGSVEA